MTPSGPYRDPFQPDSSSCTVSRTTQRLPYSAHKIIPQSSACLKPTSPLLQIFYASRSDPHRLSRFQTHLITNSKTQARLLVATHFGPNSVEEGISVSPFQTLGSFQKISTKYHSVAGTLRQFRRCQCLSDGCVCHNMATARNVVL